MLQRDYNTLDLKHQRLKIAEDVMIWPVRERDETVYRMEIPADHRFFRVGYDEYVFISLLDGQTTLPQACGLAAAKLGSHAPTAVQAGVIQRWLLKNELAYLPPDRPPSRRAQADATSGESTSSGAARDSTGSPAANGLFRNLSRINPFWIKVPLPHSVRWVNSIAELAGFLFNRFTVAASLVLMLVAFVLLASHWAEFAGSSAGIVQSGNWAWLLATWVALKLIHEIAHAAACRQHGTEVGESGLVFILFAPLAFVDVTSSWRLPSRESRIAIAAAGMFVELVIAAMAAVCWVLFDDPQIRFVLNNVIFTAGLSTLLFNANVLMRFDGYFILADLIEVPNLASEGSTATKQLAHKILLGTGSAETNLLGWRRHFVLLYGLASLLWKIVICVSLAIAASVMFSGAGIVIAAFGIVMWLGGPAKQLVQFFAELRHRDRGQFARALITSSMLTCAFGWAVFQMPVPSAIDVPASARYLPETVVRSRASGFVDRIHVNDGDLVQAGEVLVELRNPELTNQLRQLELTGQQHDVRLRQAVEKHDASERQALLESRRGVDEQLIQLRQQAAGLIIAAPRNGRVVARELAAKLGSYVEEGEPLLVVAKESDKELIAIVSQRDIGSVRACVGDAVQARTADFRSLTGTLDRIQPRAVDRLSDPALSATEGGPLAVRNSNTGEEVRLLQPHFPARVALAADVATKIPSGMRAQVSIGYRGEPIATRLRDAIRNLWHAATDR